MLSVHQSNGHLNCLQSLTIMNTTDKIHEPKSLCKHASSFFLGKYLFMGLVSCRVDVGLPL